MVWRQNDDTQKGFWKREGFQKDSFVIGTEVHNNYYRDETTHMLHLEGYYGLPFQGTAFIQPPLLHEYTRSTNGNTDQPTATRTTDLSNIAFKEEKVVQGNIIERYFFL